MFFRPSEKAVAVAAMAIAAAITAVIMAIAVAAAATELAGLVPPPMPSKKRALPAGNIMA